MRWSAGYSEPSSICQDLARQRVDPLRDGVAVHRTVLQHAQHQHDERSGRDTVVRHRLGNVAGTEWQDPDFLHQLGPEATSFALSEGESKTHAISGRAHDAATRARSEARVVRRGPNDR
jgi:hypothetical protein